MIVKQSPDDFQVEEMTHLQAGGEGNFALYRLEKRGWTTHDALSMVRRRWGLDHRRVGHGGLKDRHAHTIQYFSVFHGPRRQLNQQGIQVTYLGQLTQPYSSENVWANRFQLVLRGLDEPAGTRALAALDEVRSFGVANYFDDQRFGSVDGGGDFVARAILRGDHEKALRLALAAPYAHDRAPQKKEKAILRAHWGDWAQLKELLPRGHARSLVDYLAHHPDHFRGTLERLRPELRSLYLSAYQSHLWNRMLAAWLQDNILREQLLMVDLRLGPVPMPLTLDESQLAALKALELPLPSPRALLEEADPRRPYLERVLAEEQLTLDQFKLRGFKEMFFSRGQRPALCVPTELQGEMGEDETRPGKRKLRLSFQLPRGCYATLIVKRIAARGLALRDDSSER